MNITLSWNTIFNTSTIDDEWSSNICSSLDADKIRKIKKRLKELAELIATVKLFTIESIQNNHFQGLVLLFANGIISSIGLDHNKQILDVHHDDFVQSKLLSHHRVSSIHFALDSGIYILYVQQPTLTHISLENNFKNNKKYTKFKIKSDCQVRTIQLEQQRDHHRDGGSLKRHLTVSTETVLVWWNVGLHTKWNPGASQGCPNLLAIDSSFPFKVTARETIDGEIIKVYPSFYRTTEFIFVFHSRMNSFTPIQINLVYSIDHRSLCTI